MKSKNVLVTGGAGYIGSHTIVQLLNENYKVIVIDNLSNSKQESLNRVKIITGKEVKFYQGDILDKELLEKIFSDENIDSVIHFAGLKAVGESVEIPIRYYQNNISGTLVLCEVMKKHNVLNIVFSSSATVYGDPHKVPITEDFPLSATNPYGRSKLMIEEILKDLYVSDNKMNIAILRYFNPVGAHKSGLIGENPNGIPNNLLPYISQVAVGIRPNLNIWGNDYNTPDGTGVRDYIHVEDLANGHLKALEKLEENPGYVVYNLGTGQGNSVLEMIRAFEKASGKNIPFEFKSRRPGDIAKCYADPQKAESELKWKAVKSVDEMCEDIWRWQSKNPNGYEN